MTRHSLDRKFHTGDGDDDDMWIIRRIDRDKLDFGPPLPRFIHLVDAILAHPPSNHEIAGRNAATDATSNLFWTYKANGEFRVEAASGFLKTGAGDGGFSLTVERDGSWQLKFDGSDKVIGHEAGEPTPPPPMPGAGLRAVNIPGTGAGSYDSTSSKNPPGPNLIDGGLGFDTFQGGAGDYMIGGAGTKGGGLAGSGNCAVYTKSSGSILVDMQNGLGYGGNAEGNVYVNMNQVRGSLNSNVLIGDTNGTDLKSGGDNSILISTGGTGFEMRPDGRGNVLVSTAGADRIEFEAGHGWALGDDNIMLGFSATRGCSIDLRALTAGGNLDILTSLGGGKIASDFHTGGTGNIADYVRFQDVANDGTHVWFDPKGHASAGGYDLVDLKFVHGLDVGTLYAHSQILV